jgi:TRAP-type C4-dicarboxylate transport system permease small subunit
MNIVRTADRLLTGLVNALLVIAFALMLGLAALQVLLRGVFHGGLLWGDVAARNLVIWVGFFGAFLATRENKHFHIDVLTRFLAPRIRLWFNAFSDLFAATVCYFLLQASLTFVNVGIDPEATAFLQIPQVVIAMIVPVGFGLIGLQFLIRMIFSSANAVRGESPEGAG